MLQIEIHRFVDPQFCSNKKKARLFTQYLSGVHTLFHVATNCRTCEGLFTLLNNTDGRLSQASHITYGRVQKLVFSGISATIPSLQIF